MNIAVDSILYRKNRGGVEKAIEGAARGLCLLPEMHGQLQLFASSDLFHLLTESCPNNASIREIAYSSRPQRMLKSQMIALRHRRAPLWHYLGYVIPPIPPKGAIVVSIYDIIALTHPHLCARFNRIHYGLMLPRTIRRADRIIVPSQHVRDEIAKLFPDARPRVRVLALPLPNSAPPAEADDRDKGYLLAVGGLAPKKNVEFLLEAFSRLPPDLRARHNLWIAGREAGRRGQIEHAIDRLGARGQVRFLGYVPDERMSGLYKNAAALLFPSVEEGYGYPPLEAMALGAPAIVSDSGALPEIAGAAGATVSPLDPAQFSSHIARLLTDPDRRQRTSQDGLAKASRKTWTDYARDLQQIYLELIA